MEKEKKKSVNSKFLIVLAALVLIGGAYGIYKYQHGQSHEITDDAQIEAKISPIIPKVAGYIKEVKVRDNQWVKKGDTLLVLDNAEFVLKLQQAVAAQKVAMSQLKVAGASVKSSGPLILPE